MSIFRDFLSRIFQSPYSVGMTGNQDQKSVYGYFGYFLCSERLIAVLGIKLIATLQHCGKTFIFALNRASAELTLDLITNQTFYRMFVSYI